MKDNPKQIKRSPVVMVVGHIDHGKSTLLDFIRKSKVAEGEAGGITQHLSAYDFPGFTFIDTPGHEAFNHMRQTGAKIADVAVLVVSAEDGVKAQTLEAIKDLKESQIPFVVAINKIDRPNANPERVKQGLAEQEVLVEDYGGTVPSALTSATTGKGVDDLLNLITLLTDLLELKTDSTAQASGFVLETLLNPKVGIMATLIIKDGKLESGDTLVVGNKVCKIKRLSNFKGETVKIAYAPMPVSVIGFNELPEVGETFRTFKSKKEAEDYAQNIQVKNVDLNKSANQTGDPALEHMITIPVIIKADQAGTLEAVKKIVEARQTEKVRLKIIQAQVGPVGENDIKLGSSAKNCLILSFHTVTDSKARELALKFNLEISSFDIIYKLDEWLQIKVALLTPKRMVESVVGSAKVLKIFSVDRDKQVIGGSVIAGIIGLGMNCDIKRRESVLGKGKVLELESQKVKVKEVAKDKMFGALIDSKTTIAIGDTINVIDLIEQ